MEISGIEMGKKDKLYRGAGADKHPALGTAFFHFFHKSRKILYLRQDAYLSKLPDAVCLQLPFGQSIWLHPQGFLKGRDPSTNYISALNSH